MDLALTPDLEELIDEQLTHGRLKTPVEVVREALLLLKERASSRDAEQMVEHIQSLLNAQEHHAAQKAAARAAADHPDHPWLQRANRVLNPHRVSTTAASGSDRTKEFDWLRKNSGAYRSQWVALLGDELIAADPDVDVVLRKIRDKELDGKPLVHRID